MESEGWRRCPHTQSHQQHHCPHCPLRRHCHHCPLHNPRFLNSLSQPFPTPLPHFAPFPLQQQQQLQQPVSSHAPISQEGEHIELDGEEEDDEPVFVLSDEWREFFAKSEARRKLEKKQGKKVKK